ncbi:hypothetical protein C8Q74DRAFT_1244775 [Fomes fomentarius]|nr:hypothetical protein C8Q74DRAFT_1244775 [Fomes fomentarius]
MIRLRSAHDVRVQACSRACATLVGTWRIVQSTTGSRFGSSLRVSHFVACTPESVSASAEPLPWF